MAVRLPTASRNLLANALVDQTDVGATNPQGRLRIYSGAQPASANNAPTGDLLAEVNLANPAFGNAAAGVATLLGVPISALGLPAAGAGVAAGWFRLVDRGTNTVLDGNVGLTGSGAQLIVNTTTISENVTFEILSGTVTQPSGE